MNQRAGKGCDQGTSCPAKNKDRGAKGIRVRGYTARPKSEFTEAKPLLRQTLAVIS